MQSNRWVQATRAAGWAYLVVVTGLFILTGLLVLTSTAAPGGDPNSQTRAFGLFGMLVLALPLALGVVTAVMLWKQRNRVAYILVLVQAVLTTALWTFGVASSLGTGGTTSNLIVSALCLAIAVLVGVCAVQALRTSDATTKHELPTVAEPKRPTKDEPDDRLTREVIARPQRPKK